MGGLLTEVVGGNDDTVFELQGHDGGSCDDGLLGMCGRAVVSHEGGVVCSVDIVSGLGEVSLVIMMYGGNCILGPMLVVGDPWLEM